MTNRIAALIGVVLLAGIGALPQSANADTIKLGNDQNTWKLGNNPGVSPLMVPVKPGDVIEIAVRGTHGLATLDNPGDQASPAPAVDLSHILKCGEDPASKPNAAFQEICDSRVGKNLTLSMRVVVLGSFSQDVHFWCTEHLNIMVGTFKPAP